MWVLRGLGSIDASFVCRQVGVKGLTPGDTSFACRRANIEWFKYSNGYSGEYS